MIKKRIAFKPIDGILTLIVLTCSVYMAGRIIFGLQYHWEWRAIPQFLLRFDTDTGKWVTNMLTHGFFTTIRLSVWSTLFAVIIGTIIGLCRTSKSLFNRLMGRTYVELVRNLPPLVLIFIFYYFISDQILTALGIERIIAGCSQRSLAVLTFLFAPPDLFTRFLSALITLAIFEGAYIAEIVRAGIQSIDSGQWEASSALGLHRRQTMFFIILPQAIRKILPPLAGQFVSTIKDSAIVSVISIQELTFQGMELMSSTFLTFEIWITVTLLYLALTLSLSLGVNRLEIHMQRHDAG
ncbi:amino acid ABC transporter permease [Thermodesulfobacteriota bacterium]